MKLLVEFQKVENLAHGDSRLRGQLRAKFDDKFRIRRSRQLFDDISFNSFADEARIGDRHFVNLPHEGAALRPHFEEAFLRKLDEGLAHGLTAGREALSDFGFRQRGARPQVPPNDLGSQDGVDSRTYG